MLKRCRLEDVSPKHSDDDPLIELDEEDEETPEISQSISEDPSQFIDLDAIKKLGELRLKESVKDRLGISHDCGSDSSEDETPNRNTIGNVPLKWYQHEEHIGYDLDGKKIDKSNRKDRLDLLIEKMDKDGLVTNLHDHYNDREVEISRNELRMLLNMKKGKYPDPNIDPYEAYNPWFTKHPRIHPLSNALKPKSSFLPSSHEARKVAELVQVIKSGKLKKVDRRAPDLDKPRMIWSEDGKYDRRGNRLMYLQPPKRPLPSHEESFNPPQEYLPTKSEKQKIEENNERFKEDKYPKFIPNAFDHLRKVPGYDRYAREVFERCLDLFMCPRTKLKKSKRTTINREEFFPDLPKPNELQPFPTKLYIKFLGHEGKVRTLSVHPSGQWLASGANDGQVRVWEVATGRCLLMTDFGTPVSHLCWHPAGKILLIAAGKRASLLVPFPRDAKSVKSLLKVRKADNREDTQNLSQWTQREDGGIDIIHSWVVSHTAWHANGDYFAVVQPSGGTKSVMIHRLSLKASQCPFKKSHGVMVQVGFHPIKSHFIVMAEDQLRIYDLMKQNLVKKLTPKNKGAMTCFDIHPGGENILIGSEDNKISWYDLELSTRPYKSLQFHKHAIRVVSFHQSYPLFASASDDCTVQVFHGMVYDDLNMNALIVPVKILKGHTFTDSSGVLACEFHPNQPWIFTAGADGKIYLYCN